MFPDGRNSFVYSGRKLDRDLPIQMILALVEENCYRRWIIEVMSVKRLVSKCVDMVVYGGIVWLTVLFSD